MQHNELSVLHLLAEIADLDEPETCVLCMNKLMDAGASLKATDRYGETPFTTFLCLMEDYEEKDEDNMDVPDEGLAEALITYLERGQEVDNAVAARLLHQIDRMPELGHSKGHA